MLTQNPQIIYGKMIISTMILGQRYQNQSQILNAHWTGTTQPFDSGQWLSNIVI